MRRKEKITAKRKQQRREETNDADEKLLKKANKRKRLKKKHRSKTDLRRKQNHLNLKVTPATTKTMTASSKIHKNNREKKTTKL